MTQIDENLREGNSLPDLLQFLHSRKPGAIILEGPRGSGKTTLARTIAEAVPVYMYKTWGMNQREDRAKLISLGLDLPQGAYFALDFLSQIKVDRPILIDRTILSAIVYQYNLWGDKHDLHKYYVSLMKRCDAVLLYLEVELLELARRRVSRKFDDEQKLCIYSEEDARRIVRQDIDSYDFGLTIFQRAGLTDCPVPYQIDSTVAWLYDTSERTSR